MLRQKSTIRHSEHYFATSLERTSVFLHGRVPSKLSDDCFSASTTEWSVISLLVYLPREGIICLFHRSFKGVLYFILIQTGLGIRLFFGSTWDSLCCTSRFSSISPPVPRKRDRCTATHFVWWRFSLLLGIFGAQVMLLPHVIYLRF